MVESTCLEVMCVREYPATVLTHSLRHVRMIRSAISPLFAISIFLNTGTPWPYKGMFPCFLGGLASLFVLKRSKYLIRTSRVSLGLITSSMYPCSAAMYGFANFCL